MTTYHIYKRIIRVDSQGEKHEQLIAHRENGHKIITCDPHNYMQCQTRSGTLIFIPDNAVLTLTVQVETLYNAEIVASKIGMP